MVHGIRKSLGREWLLKHSHLTMGIAFGAKLRRRVPRHIKHFDSRTDTFEACEKGNPANKWHNKVGHDQINRARIAFGYLNPVSPMLALTRLSPRRRCVRAMRHAARSAQ